MLWMTQQERVVLAGLGALALVALGLLAWQRHRPAWTVTAFPVPAESVAWDDTLRAAREVDVNTATVAELERLPEIGPTLARRIVEYRIAHGRFRTPGELVQVPGIGPKTAAALEGYVTAQ